MGNIYKRGENWYIDLRVDGRRIRKRIGTSKETAKLVLKDFEVKAARQEFGFLKEDVPLQRFLDEFLKYCQVNHRPTTFKRYRAVIDHFRSFLENHPSIVLLSQVTRATIDQFKIHRRETWVNPNGYPVKSEIDVSQQTRRGAKAKTINFEVACIGTAFNLAVKWNYLKENPTKGVTKFKVDKSKQPRFLSQDEIERLLSACPMRLYPILVTFLNTGMRKAELENLQWTDVDLTRRQISIRAKADWLPKTGERVIPVNDRLLTVLKAHKSSCKPEDKNSYVFGEQDGTIIKTKLREQFIRVAKVAGIQDLTKLHTLRHTFASHLVMKGVDLPTVQKLMGHSDIETTMIYSHLAESHLVDAVNKL